MYVADEDETPSGIANALGLYCGTVVTLNKGAFLHPGQISSQPPTDSTRFGWHLYVSWLKKPSIFPWDVSKVAPDVHAAGYEAIVGPILPGCYLYSQELSYVTSVSPTVGRLVHSGVIHYMPWKSAVWYSTCGGTGYSEEQISPGMCSADAGCLAIK